MEAPGPQGPAPRPFPRTMSSSEHHGFRDRFRRGARPGPPPDAPRPVPPVAPLSGREEPEELLWIGHDRERQGAIVAAVEAYLAAALAWEGSGRHDAALDAVARAVRIAPGDPAAHGVMERIYRRRGWTAHADERAAILDRLRAAGVDEPHGTGA